MRKTGMRSGVSGKFAERTRRGVVAWVVLAAFSVSDVASGVGSSRGEEPVLGTFALDPVLLVRDGAEVPGEADREVKQGCYRYRFATDATRDAFVALPEAYEIQLGGACGRMGALSGVGRTDLFAVHDGQLFIFASEACREGFRKDPSKVLEPVYEEPREGSDLQKRRGRERIEQAVLWLGGAERLDGASVRMQRESTQEWEGEERRSADVRVTTPDGRHREETIWDERAWVMTLTPDDAFFVDAQSGVRSMRPVQRQALERRRQSDVVALLQGRGRPDFVAVAEEADEQGTERVHVHLAGMNHTLVIDPASGAILRHAFLGWGPRMSLGRLERTYERWTMVSGVRLPVAWSRTFQGEEIDPVRREEPEYDFVILQTTPADLFARPSQR